MVDLNAGRAYIEIVPSLKDFQKRNAAEMRKQGAAARRAYDEGFNTGATPDPPAPDAKKYRAKGQQAGSQYAGAFDREVRTKVTAALKSLPEAKVGADATDADREIAQIRAALERLSTKRIGVDIDDATALNRLQTLQAKLAEISASDDATIGVKANTAKASLELDKIRLEAERVGALSPTITVDADTTAAQAQLAAVGAGGAVSSSAGVGALATAALTLGPALIPGGAAAVGGLAGLGAAGAAGGTGIGVAALALHGVGDAVTALGEAQDTQGKTAEQVARDNEKAIKAMEGLSPAGRSFAKFLNGLRGSISDLQADAAKGFLPGLQKGMKAGLDAMKPFRGIVTSVADELGSMAEAAGKGLGGPAFQDFFAMVQRTAGPTLGLVGDIIGNLARAFAGLAVAFQPVATQVLTGLKKLTDRFADFANQGEGGGLSKFVNYVRENGPKVAAMIGALARAFGHVIKAMAPFGEWVVAALTKVGNGIASLPIGVLRALIGVVIGLTLAWKAAAMMAGAISNAIRIWTTLTKISLVVGKAKLIWTKAVTAATKAWAVAQRILNAVLRGNPIGLVVTALILLGTGLVLAYKKSETFRRIVNAAWAGIKKAAKATVAWFKNTAWPWMKNVFQNIGKVAMWLWRNAIRPAFNFIWNIAKKVFRWIKNTGWPMVRAAFRGIGKVASWLWNKGIKPAFTFIWNIAKKVFQWIKNTGWPMVRTAFRAIGKVATWLWRKGIKPVFNFIWDLAKKVFRWIRGTGVKWIRQALNWIIDKVRQSWRGWKRIFNWIWDKAKAVFRWVKNTGVKWIRQAFNWIIDKVRQSWRGWKKIFGWIQDKASAVFRWVKNTGVKWIRRAFDRIVDKAQWLWDKVKAVFDKLKDGVRKVKDAIGDAKDGIRRAWGKIYSAIKSPIKKAIRWLNKHFIGKLNSMLGKIGISWDIPKIPTKGWDRGGILPGYTSMSRGDDQLTPMRSGEGVMVSEGLRDGRSRSMFLAANAAAKRGTSFADFMGGGFARGGILGNKLSGKKMALVALGRELRREGYHVSEHPKFGGVAHGAHMVGSKHYSGEALDINADPWLTRFASETKALSRLNRRLRSKGWHTLWKTKDHFDHLHVDTGSGSRSGNPLSGLIDGFKNAASWVKGKFDKLTDGFDPSQYGIAGKVLPAVFKRIRGVVKDKVKGAFDALSFGDSGSRIDFSGIKGATNRIIGKKMAARYGWTGSQWTALKYLWQRESGWNQHAHNPTSGAHGIPQSLPASKMRSYGADYMTNPKTQIAWGLNYIKQRYGSPASAWRSWNRRSPHWYARGTESAMPGWSVIGENGPELVRTAGGEQIFNRRQTLRLAELASQSGPALSGPVVVNVVDRDGTFADRMRGEIEEYAAFSASVGRMNLG